MEKTLREHLKNNYQPMHDAYDTERFSAAVGYYYSCKGMEWTSDDEAVIREYGHDPKDYLNFSDEQLTRLDEVQDAVIDLCKKLVQWPDGHDHNRENAEVMDDLYTAKIWCQIADSVSEFLHNNGFSVYFPTHVETDDEKGTQYITDEWGRVYNE